MVNALISKGLAERVEGRLPDQPLERISAKGLEAIGVEAEPATGEPAPEPPQAEASVAQATAQPEAGAAPAEPKAPRAGTKLALLGEMLSRPEGATVAEIVSATGWQPHTVRGAIAGSLKKKLGLTVGSEKVDERGRVYRISEVEPLQP